MNIKKLSIVSLAVFVVIVVTDFVIHNILLSEMYIETAHLWRGPEGMILPAMVIGQAVIALFFSWIFLVGYQGKGWIEGVRFGLLITGFQLGSNLIMYSVTPYPVNLVVAWVMAALVQSVLAAVIAALVVQKIN